MIFPDVDRCVYKNNPLIEVLSQLRFTPILSIKTKGPDKLQENIKKDFPTLDIKEITNINITDLEAYQDTYKLYVFLSKDKNYKFTLCEDFISLTCMKYTDWESYKKNMELVYGAFHSLYSPEMYTRVGLRYKNVISSDILDDESVEWCNYINSSLSACYSDKFMSKENIKDFWSKLLVDIDIEDTLLNVNYGSVTDTESNRIGFLIDGDFFTKENIEVKGLDNVYEKLGQYKEQSYKFFRWAISDELHEKLGPRKHPNS